MIIIRLSVKGPVLARSGSEKAVRIPNTHLLGIPNRTREDSPKLPGVGLPDEAHLEAA
jgi:hypothetical protein